jgi:ABC-type oligopeptide transport system ATPase subunit
MTALLEISGLEKRFRLRGGRVLQAVAGVSLSIAPGEVLALVGESGCGKSTLGRCLLRLEEIDGGEIRFDGQRIDALRATAFRPLRQRIQMVFQDPYGSLDPRMTVAEILAEPLTSLGLVRNRHDAAPRVLELLDMVRMPRSCVAKKPHEFSGGQRQRIGIARALATWPDLLVCDEAVSALDVSVKAQIVNLLSDLRAELGLAMLFISHDLAIVERIADRVAVMYLGRIVETGDAEAIFSSPGHPYTRGLLAAAPRIDALSPPTGCCVANRPIRRLRRRVVVSTRAVRKPSHAARPTTRRPFRWRPAGASPATLPPIPFPSRWRTHDVPFPTDPARAVDGACIGGTGSRAGSAAGGALGMTARLLVSMDRLGDAAISPDGRWIAYVVRTMAPDLSKSATHILLADQDHPKQPHVALQGGPGRQDMPTWSADGHTLYFRGPDAKGVAQIWRAGSDGAAPVQLTHAPLDVGAFQVAADGGFAVASFRVFPDCPTLECTVTRAAQPSVGTLYTSLNVRFFDSYGDGRYNALFRLDLGDGKAATPLMPGFASDVPSRPAGSASAFALSPDGKTLVFSARPSGVSANLSTMHRLFEVSLAAPAAPREIGAETPDRSSTRCSRPMAGSSPTWTRTASVRMATGRRCACATLPAEPSAKSAPASTAGPMRSRGRPTGGRSMRAATMTGASGSTPIAFPERWSACRWTAFPRSTSPDAG